MDNPVVVLGGVCSNYLQTLDQFTALQNELGRLAQVESGVESEDDPAFTEARISLVTAMNDIMTVPVPLNKRILTSALTAVSLQLAEILSQIHTKSGEAIAKIEEGKKCQTPPKSSTSTG